MEELSNKVTQEDIDNFTDKYMDRWNIPRDKNYFSVKKVKVDWSTKVNGDIWFEDDKWHVKRDGIVIVSAKKPSVESVDMVQFYKCTNPECNKVVNNKNELQVISSRGLCFSCLAKKELNDIINNVDYESHDMSNFIVIKNSMGEPIMDIDDYRNEYGDEEADKLIQEYKNKQIRLKNNAT